MPDRRHPATPASQAAPAQPEPPQSQPCALPPQAGALADALADGHGPVNPQKHRRGLSRLWHAGIYSMHGLRAAWGEGAAFRQEALAAAVMLPAAFWLGRQWSEVALLAGCVVLVLVAELLNSGIEAAIDRIGPERHPLSKQAKDMGSAAVLLALLLAAGVWLAALCARL